jgi:hypothetical protein
MRPRLPFIKGLKDVILILSGLLKNLKMAMYLVESASYTNQLWRLGLSFLQDFYSVMKSN